MSIVKQVSLHGKRAYVSRDNQVGAKNGFVAGGVDKPAIVLPGSPDTVAIFDDFIGDSGRTLRGNTDPYWRVIDGDTGTDTGSNVRIAPGTSGIVRITNGDTPIDQVKMGLNQSLSWKGNQKTGVVTGGLRMGLRLKSSGWHDTGQSTVNIWAGFTDTLAAEVPVMDSGGVVVSTAANAFGVGFNSLAAGGDTGWVAYAVNADVNATPVVLDTTVALNKYDVIEMELRGGVAYFWIDGVPKGSIKAPVAETVALTPTILVWGDSGGGQTVDVDWINVSAPRDSGL